MATIVHMTLADLKNDNPEQFDSIINESLHQAALDVGKEVVIAALCNPARAQEQLKAA